MRKGNDYTVYDNDTLTTGYKKSSIPCIAAVSPICQTC